MRARYAETQRWKVEGYRSKISAGFASSIFYSCSDLSQSLILRNNAGRPDRAAGVTGRGGQIHFSETACANKLCRWPLNSWRNHRKAQGSARDSVGVRPAGARRRLLHKQSGRNAPGPCGVARAAHQDRAAGPSSSANFIAIKLANFRSAVVPTIRNVIGVMAEVAQVQLELSIVRNLDQPAHLPDELRLAIRRQSHHLVFVTVMGEADELRNCRIKDSERMREINTSCISIPLARPSPNAVLAKSPKPSTDKQAASSKPETRKAEAKMRVMMLDVM